MALADRGGAVVRKTLAAVAARRDAARDVRLAAVQALGRMGDAESLATTSNGDPMKGELLVGFEGSKATTRVLRYNVGAQGFAAVPVPQIGLAAGNARISMCVARGFHPLPFFFRRPGSSRMDLVPRRFSGSRCLLQQDPS